jgi:pimeloyl-ACP methyl ester carboxylesterase
MPTQQQTMRSGMAAANGIELYYEDIGDPAAPPVFLVMGLGAQHVYWPENVVQGLLANGFRVIRFDNRDIGLSTKIKTREYDSLPRAYLKSTLRERVRSPYTLYDLADDTLGLMDALKLDSVHLVGASMGGMISQLTAALHRDRVRSLTSIMSSTLHPKLPWPKLGVLGRLAMMGRRGEGGREDFVSQTVATYRAIHGKGFPFAHERVEQMAGIAFDRCYHPRGAERQGVGILATGSFETLLGRVRAPTLVVHGDQDPLVPMEGGKATARAVKGSRLQIVKGMGHGMPEPMIPDLVGWISETVRKAER